MKDLRTIFNHPKQSDPERDPHLYDWRRPFHGKDDAAYLNKLLKRRSRRSSPARISFGSTRYNGFENIRKQRVFFTATYSKSIKSHKKYILDYMPQKNKPGASEEKEMFGVPPEDYLNNMAPLHFKWIISPESQNVDVLRATGRYNLYLEEYLKSDLPLRLFEGGNITGKVDKVINFDRDESWNDAIIIRKENERIYIPVYQLHKDHLEGKTIRIEHVAGGTNRNITNKDIRIVDNKNRDISMSR